MRADALLFGDSKRRVNLSAVARELGVSRMTINNWRKSPGKMQIHYLARYARLLGLTPHEIGIAVLEMGGER